MLDLKIQGGDLLDGRGRPAVRLDVGIESDRIVQIGDLSNVSARRVLNANQCVVCPGFIDVHSHSDAYLLIEPTASSKLFQGVTTEVIGNCGASASPRLGQARLPSDWEDKRYPAVWTTVGDYRSVLASVGPAVNVVLLVGHNTLRAGVAGYADRPLQPDEQRLLVARLEQAMDEGAHGLSSGLLYAPGLFAPESEVCNLVAAVARRGGVYTTHLRSEGGHLLDALDEALRVAAETGVRLEISHLKTSGRSNWHLLDAALERIECARSSGLVVAADRYPYTAACTDLDVVFPDWAAAGGRAVVLARLRDGEQRRRIRDSLVAERPAAYWQDVMVGSTRVTGNRGIRGRWIPDIAAEWGVEPVDAVLRLLDADALGTTAFFFGMSEPNLFRILAQPWVMLGSDASLRAPSGVLSHDHPHPRAYGAFARFLRMSLDGSTVPLTEAIRKMTALPASQFGLTQRGILEINHAADVVVFDPLRIRDVATYDDPHRLAEGVVHVVVNGIPAIVEGRLDGRRNGRIL